VIAIDLSGGPALSVKHVGPYEDLGETYGLIERWLDEHHRGRAGAVREQYMTDPSVPPAQHVTFVIQPLQA
jgi:effector-binding domain-containing protein